MPRGTDQLYRPGSITLKALNLLPSYFVFRKWYKFLQQSQFWSRKQLEDYQLQQLSMLLEHAYENVPYYRKVFDERGLKPKDIQDFKDLPKLPFLTKDIIRNNLSYLKARNYPDSKFEHVTTGGSTGLPLGVYYEKGASLAKEWAFMKTQWDRVGYNFRDKCVVLRGNVVDPITKSRFWKPAFFRRWLIFSSYHMTDENLPIYIKKMRQFKPKFIQAYPSTIIIIARFMKKNKIKPFNSIKGLLCGSENLYPWQRKLLEEVFQCRVYSWYGHAEMAVLAGECEKSTYYHLFPEYGFIELINKDGKTITTDDEIGEIVATGFNNWIFPLIRYRTMDLAVKANIKCECGRNYPQLKRIEGRLQELIVANDGGLISLGPAIFGIHDSEWTKIKQIQFLQETPGELIIQIVKNSSNSDAEIESYILELFKTRFEGRCKLSVRFVEHIPRTQSGKYRFLIQNLPIDFGDYKYES